MAEVKQKLTKDERHELIVAINHFIASQEDSTLRTFFDVEQKDLSLITNKLQAAAWRALTESFPYLANEAHILQMGLLRVEILKHLGEMSELHSLKHMPAHIREKAEFKEKLTSAATLYKAFQVRHGKRPAPSISQGIGPQAKRPQIKAHRSYDDVSIPGPPHLYIVKKEVIYFSPEMRLGEGSFGYATKCCIEGDEFPHEVYVAKVVKNTDQGLAKKSQAALEACALTVTHRGLISACAFCPDEAKPMIIFPFWNGGNLQTWTWIARNEGKEPPSWLKTVPLEVGNIQRFRKYAFHIINAILVSLEFLHEHDILHNDLHLQNILIHFSKNSDAVYAGIADWGKSTPKDTIQSCPRLPDDQDATKRRWGKQYPWIAPECFSHDNPPHFSKSQDVWSVCWIIKEILNSLRFANDDPARRFSHHILSHIDKGMNPKPSLRPPAYELTLATAGSSNYSIILDRTSGLRPFNE